MNFKVAFPINCGSEDTSHLVEVDLFRGTNHYVSEGVASGLNPVSGSYEVHHYIVPEDLKKNLFFKFTVEILRPNLSPKNLTTDGNSDFLSCLIAYFKTCRNIAKDGEPFLIVFSGGTNINDENRSSINRTFRPVAQGNVDSLKNKWSVANKSKALAFVLHKEDAVLLKTKYPGVELIRLEKKTFKKLILERNKDKETPIVYCGGNEISLLSKSLGVYTRYWEHKPTILYRLLIGIFLFLIYYFFYPIFFPTPIETAKGTIKIYYDAFNKAKAGDLNAFVQHMDCYHPRMIDMYQGTLCKDSLSKVHLKTILSEWKAGKSSEKDTMEKLRQKYLSLYGQIESMVIQSLAKESWRIDSPDTIFLLVSNSCSGKFLFNDIKENKRSVPNGFPKNKDLLDALQDEKSEARKTFNTFLKENFPEINLELFWPKFLEIKASALFEANALDLIPFLMKDKSIFGQTEEYTFGLEVNLKSIEMKKIDGKWYIYQIGHWGTHRIRHDKSDEKKN